VGVAIVGSEIPMLSIGHLSAMAAVHVIPAMVYLLK
jgi:hypothetical protein